MKTHILFITSTNLASNPRCRKEIDLALNLHYQVTYIAFDMPGWTREKERQIQNEFPEVEKIYLQAGKVNFLSWSVRTFLEIFLRKIYKHISVISLISFAVSKTSLQLLVALKKLKVQPNLVIAHNPAAFYPAYYYSKTHKVPFAVDVEDYHPGEENNKVVSALTIKLIKKILPFSEYVSFAAPLIKEKITLDVLPGTIKSSLIINNTFSKKDFVKPLAKESSKIKLVWFSQNIDKGRGLEKILSVIESLKDYFEITLIGNVRENFYTTYLVGKENINVVSSLAQKKLNEKLAEFDIGLAIEVSAANENRDICLTNKIWSYFQAGLFIIASDTIAQQNFLKQFSQHGIIVNLNDNEKLQQDFLNIHHQWAKLKTHKIERFEKAKAYSWEIETAQLQMKWKEILKY